MIRRLFVLLASAVLTVSVFLTGAFAKSDVPVNFQLPSQADLNTFKAAVKANPNDDVAHIKLGNWYLQAGILETAIKEFRRAVQLNGTCAVAWNNLGSAYYARNKYKDAVKYYRKATEIQPDLAVAHRNLGSALLTLGRLEASLESFRRALDLNPTILETMPDLVVVTPSPNALTHYYYFAKLCAASGQIDSAFEFLKKAQAKGFADFQRVRNDPDFKNVIADARFESLERGIGN